MGLLLAPYNDSMRLGQGYNSFLQSPCTYNAVTITTKGSQSTSPSINTSQTASYSSHVVTRISDITRSMGISTGSSIKNGSIAVSGNASGIDESKFVESDLNVIVSVKVSGLNVILSIFDELNLTLRRLRYSARDVWGEHDERLALVCMGHKHACI
jgi:hypothetical protein